MLTKCPSCGNKISQNAKTCPHCTCVIETFRKPEMKPCRSCRTPLAVKEHYAMIYKSDPKILDRSPVSAHVKHTPCPRCGDPRPLDETFAPPRSKKPVLLAAVLAFVTIAVAIFVWMKFAGH